MFTEGNSDGISNLNWKISDKMRGRIEILIKKTYMHKMLTGLFKQMRSGIGV